MHLRMPKLIAISQFRIQLQSETAYFISYNMIGSSEENVDLFEIWWIIYVSQYITDLC